MIALLQPFLLPATLVLAALLAGQTYVANRLKLKLADTELTLSKERGDAESAALKAQTELAQARQDADMARAAGQERNHEQLAEIERRAAAAAAAADRLRNALARAKNDPGRGAPGSDAALVTERASRAALEAVASQCHERYRELDAVTRRIHAAAEQCGIEYDIERARSMNGGDNGQLRVPAPAGLGPVTQP